MVASGMLLFSPIGVICKTYFFTQWAQHRLPLFTQRQHNVYTVDFQYFSSGITSMCVCTLHASSADLGLGWRRMSGRVWWFEGQSSQLAVLFEEIRVGLGFESLLFSFCLCLKIWPASYLLQLPCLLHYYGLPLWKGTKINISVSSLSRYFITQQKETKGSLETSENFYPYTTSFGPQTSLRLYDVENVLNRCLLSLSVL